MVSISPKKVFLNCFMMKPKVPGFYYLSSCTRSPSKSRVFLPILTFSFSGKKSSNPQAFGLLGLKHGEFGLYFSINCRGSRIWAVNVDKKHKILRPNAKAFTD